MGNVIVDFRELQQFQRKFEQMNRAVQQDFAEECAKELAARLLRKAIKRTPVGVYGNPVSFTTKDGKQVHFVPKANKNGGTLRRAWSTANKDIRIIRTGSLLRVSIINPTKYASYVEYGHRTPGGKGWVEGRFMMTISVNEIRSIAPSLLQKRLEERIREAFR